MPLSNSQYDCLMREYSRKQARNQQIVSSRREELYRQIPDLKQIDEEVASSSCKTAALMLDGDGEAYSRLRQQISQLHDRRTALMKAAGYAADYLEPPYDCADCRDSGFVNGKKCHCFTQAAINLVYTQSHLSEILKRENFDTFSFDYYSDEITDPATGITSLEAARRAFEETRQFAKCFAAQRGNLLLYGNTGVGKTFLSNCVAKELLDQGFSVVYFTAFQLFDIFEKTVFQRDKSAFAEHEEVFECDVLIIDDLGTELSNAFTTGQLFLCLNERLLHGKSTIISTNLSMQKIAEIYSERTFSRISSNYKFIKLFGDDIRIKKKVQNTGKHTS